MNRKLAAIFIVLALLLGACAKQAPQPGPSSTSPTQSAAQPAATKAPGAGKRIVRLLHSWPAYVDPAIDTAMLGMTMYVNVYDTLVIPTTTGELKPWVAEKWEVSSDALTYTYYLKKGIKFHDGTELKASDVAFSMKRLLRIGQGAAYLFEGHVQSATALNDYTVQFKLDAPYALFPLTILRLFIVNEKEVMAHLEKPGDYGEFGDFAKKYLLTHDVGSGAYKVKDVQLEQYVLLEKNPDWWAKDKFVPNAPDEVRFMPRGDPATLRTLMANRQLEISDQWQSLETYQALDNIEGVDIAVFDGLSMYNLYMNNKKPPTDDIHFRRAMIYAFDYQAAADIDWPRTTPAEGPVPSGIPGFNRNLKPYRQDLEKARAELAQSKYAGKLGQYPVEVLYVGVSANQQKITLLLQANLAAIGIKAELVGVPFLTIQERLSKQDTTANITSVYMSAELPEAGFFLLQRFHSRSAGTFMQGEWLQDKALDQKIDEAMRTLDRDKRFQLSNEIQAYVMDLAPTIFGYNQLLKHAYQKYVDWPAAKGVVYPVMGYNQWFAFIGVDNP